MGHNSSTMAEARGVAILQNEIEKAKDKLKDVNENIKKLTGRDLVDINSRPGRGRQPDARGRGRLFNLARRGIMPEESGVPQGAGVRRFGRGGAFARLGPMPSRRREKEDSGDEDEPPSKLSVHSSVVATSKDSRSRQDTMAEQSKDREGLQRNRRMFGLLLGTLQKFKSEASQQDQKAEQRKEIEKKLEEKAEKEKKRYIQETQLLIEESQLEQAKITRLQQKMELVAEHEATTHEMKKLYHFICTKAKPRIFYKPKQMNPAAEAKLKESKKTVDKLISEKDKRLDHEIKEIMEREHVREERLRSRLRTDKENDDDDEEVEDTYKSRSRSKDGREGHYHKSQEKKDGHRHSREAKKKPQEMQYDDGEEEESQEKEKEERVAKGGKRGRKGSREDEEGKGREEKGGSKGSKRKEREDEAERKEKEREAEKTAAQKLKESIENDGNHTDVDYEDDESSPSNSSSSSDGGSSSSEDEDDGERKKKRARVEEEEGTRKSKDREEDTQTPQEDKEKEVPIPSVLDREQKPNIADLIPSMDVLAAIPMPAEPGREGSIEAAATLGPWESEGSGVGQAAPVPPTSAVGITLDLETRRRRAILAEDAEDSMDQELPADE